MYEFGRSRVCSIYNYDNVGNMILIACDPGKSGAIVVKNTEYPLSIQKFRTENREDVFDAFYEIYNMWDDGESERQPAAINNTPRPVLYMEDVHFTHRDGKKQVWSFSAAVERVLMSAEIYGVEVVMVSPQKWQEALGLKDGSSDLNGGTGKKKMLCEAAKEMYPYEAIYQWNADAYLILRYGEMCEQSRQ